MTAEYIARAFHAAYERLAPEYGYETREASAKPWEDVPKANRALMVATVSALVFDGVIATGSGPQPPMPSVGRIVHYVSYGTPGGEYSPECRAAIVTAVRDRDPVPEHGVPYVDLCVLNPSGMFFNQNVRYDEWDSNEALQGATPQGGSWHWPERT